MNDSFVLRLIYFEYLPVKIKEAALVEDGKHICQLSSDVGNEQLLFFTTNLLVYFIVKEVTYIKDKRTVHVENYWQESKEECREINENEATLDETQIAKRYYKTKR
ncbi:unnamed protein product [Schistosoma rodhaini]|uniref:Uncharacterized protein n=1 Tax=Schistosoma rodhaini TaxID=6188 RepID=A0AA85FRD3_9TREM|nr:unnamed protein product [Schistosoma rodhaini]